eukprot:jgi/Mesen1/11075/ME000099S10520
MAAIAAFSTPVVSGLGLERLSSSFSVSSRPIVAAGAPIRSLRYKGVRCQAKNGPLGQIKDAVAGTKVKITEEDVERHQAEDESEKKSVFGTKPTSGSFYPRPEVERRPETGNTSFGSVMSFDGPGPETINGRLAMLGCAWALVAEKMSGLRIVDQVMAPNSNGFYWLAIATNITIIASLIPFFQGESPDSRRNGPFTAKAERWNGRIAMIGFAGLLAFEQYVGRPFF